MVERLREPSTHIRVSKKVLSRFRTMQNYNWTSTYFLSMLLDLFEREFDKMSESLTVTSGNEAAFCKENKGMMDAAILELARADGLVVKTVDDIPGETLLRYMDALPGEEIHIPEPGEPGYGVDPDDFADVFGVPARENKLDLSRLDPKYPKGGHMGRPPGSKDIVKRVRRKKLPLEFAEAKKE